MDFGLRVPLGLAPPPSVDARAREFDSGERARAFVADALGGGDAAALAREVEQVGQLEIRESTALLAQTAQLQQVQAGIRAGLAAAVTELHDALEREQPSRDVRGGRGFLASLWRGVRPPCPGRVGESVTRVLVLRDRLAVHVDATHAAASMLATYAARLDQLVAILADIDTRLGACADARPGGGAGASAGVRLGGGGAADLVGVVAQRRREVATHAVVVAQARAALDILVRDQTDLASSIDAAGQIAAASRDSYRLAAAAALTD